MASSSSSSSILLLFLLSFLPLLILTSPSSPSSPSSSSSSSSSSIVKIPLSPPTSSKFPSSDPWQTLQNLASLSLSRSRHLKKSHKPKTHNPNSSHTKTPLFPRSYGGYSISLSFGTPPQTLKFVMDTGSSLVWFPCTSRYLCSRCNFPNVVPSNLPKFIPKLSSSSKLVGCKNPKCAQILGPNVKSQCSDCRNCTQSCPPYIIQYCSGTTAGLLLTESLDFPEKIVSDFLVGCSILSIRQPEGIAGFGRNPESLPSQLGLKKFSYCLVSHSFDDLPVSTDLVLDSGSGSSGNAKTDGLSYTSFLKNPNPAFQDFYYVLLRKIVVGDKRVKIPYSFLVPGADGNGGTIVDSGSTFTFMERPVFELVAKEFEKQMMGNYSVATGVENRTRLRPCFNITGQKSVHFPGLVFQFKGGAKMKLPVANYFSFVELGVVCLTMVSDDVVGPNVKGGPAIILGNYQQRNFNLEFDLGNERFGFKQESCKIS